MSEAPSSLRSRSSPSLRRAQALAVAAVLALAALTAWALHGPTSAAGPVIARAEGRCVAPPEEMRRRHPELLRHQRDRTVREGQRGAAASLEACVNCHATPTSAEASAPRSVLGSDAQFCQGCHSYAAVKPDCFECHSSRPAGPGHPTGPSGPAGPITATTAAKGQP